MRDMTTEEIMEFINYWTWGTLIGVEEGGIPYAVELSYGTDGNYIYCGSKPSGRMARCVLSNRNVAFKICDSDRSYAQWRAVIIEGQAERLTAYDDILHAVRCIAKQRGLDEHAFDSIAKRVADNPQSNSLRIKIAKVGGVMSG